MARFKVTEESETGHCCFGWSVIDTTRPLNRFPHDKRFNPVCECFTIFEAEMICTALNTTLDK